MAKITITIESPNATVPNGKHSTTRIVPDDYDPAFVATLMNHPSHSKVSEQIMADTGQADEDGKPILGPATQVRDATFVEAFDKWADANVFDPMVEAAVEAKYQQEVASKLAEVERIKIPVDKG